MAVTVGQLARAIRATTLDDAAFTSGPIFDDVARLRNGITALIDGYAKTAPSGVKDLALIQMAQYLFDAPPSQRRFTTSALRESGASSLLAPYRKHRLGIEAAVDAVAQDAGVDRESVIAIVRELISDWAFIGSQTAIPGEGAGLDQGAVDNRIGALVWDWAQAADNGPIDTVGKITEAMIFGFVKNILLEGQGIDITDVDATNRITIANTQVGAGGGGLNQAAVDARINTLIPANRRMVDPTGFTSSDDGSFAVWDNDDGIWENSSFKDGNGFTWTFDKATHEWSLNSDKLDQAAVDARIAAAPSGGLNQAAVDARVTALVPDWARMARRFTDEQSEVFGAFTGDRWIDDASYQVSQAFYADEATARAAVGTAAFGATFSQGTRSQNVWAIGRTPKDDTDDYRLAIGTFGAKPDIFATLKLSGATADSGIYRYSFFSIADKPAGDDVKIEKYNKIVLDYSKFENVYETASWARQGDTTPIPGTKIVQRGLRILKDGAITGINVTSANQSKAVTRDAVVPTFDLDDNPNGEFHLEITYDVSVGRSVNTIGLDTNAATTKRVVGIAFATTLAAADAFVLGGAVEGLLIDESKVYNGSTEIGSIRFYMMRDAANAVSYGMEFVTAAGSNAESFTIGANLELSFTPSDAPAVSADDSGGLSYELIHTFTTSSSSGTHISLAIPSGSARDAFNAHRLDPKAIGFLIFNEIGNWNRQCMLWKGPVAFTNADSLTGIMADVSGASSPRTAMVVLDQTGLTIIRTSTFYWAANNTVKVYKVT